MRTVIVLLAFVILYPALSISSYRQKSLALDEGSHITDGYLLLTQPDHEIRADRTRLLNFYFALPLLAQKIQMPDVSLDNRRWFNHEFFFTFNDCDKIIFWPRFMVVTLGSLLGLIVFLWARELYGFWPATFALGLFTLEPNLLTNAGVVTQDLGATLLFFATTYFLWRLSRQATVGNCLGFACIFALGIASKFSLFLLIPTTVLCLGYVVTSPMHWPMRIRREITLTNHGAKALAAAGILAITAAIAVLTIWATYGFHYHVGSQPPRALHEETVFREKSPVVASVAGLIDRYHWLPNDYTQSFLDGMRVSVDAPRKVYVAGKIREAGCWFYFPLLFLIKTPLTLILSFFCGLVLWFREARQKSLDLLLLVLPPALFFAALISGRVNMGIRHMLPIYPALILVATATAAWLIQNRHGRIAGLIVVLAAVELDTVYPHYRAFFNYAIGGPDNGHKYVVDSNVDWGQDIKLLKRWMDERRVTRINFGYWGDVDPFYYRLECVPLPSPSVQLLAATINGELTFPDPNAPGLTAISVNLLHDTEDSVRSYYEPMLHRKPVAIIGHSIYVYWSDPRDFGIDWPKIDVIK